MPDIEQRYYFDTVVLSNFAMVKRLDLLNILYSEKLYITTEVTDEISTGISVGYKVLQEILNTVENGTYYIHSLSPLERQLYTTLLTNLGSGEASSISAAKTVNGIVVTDDKYARNICRERGLKVTGTIGILKKLYSGKILQASQADNILEEMIGQGFYSPVNNISQLENNLYKKT